MRIRIVAALVALLASPVAVIAQDAQGRGALRPYIHIFVAYGLVWVLIGIWVWRIGTRLKVLERVVPRDDGSA